MSLAGILRDPGLCATRTDPPWLLSSSCLSAAAVEEKGADSRLENQAWKTPTRLEVSEKALSRSSSVNDLGSLSPTSETKIERMVRLAKGQHSLPCGGGAPTDANPSPPLSPTPGIDRGPIDPGLCGPCVRSGLVEGVGSPGDFLRLGERGARDRGGGDGGAAKAPKR